MWKVTNRAKSFGTYRVGGAWRNIAPGGTATESVEPCSASVGVGWVKMLEKAGSVKPLKVPAPRVSDGGTRIIPPVTGKRGGKK